MIKIQYINVIGVYLDKSTKREHLLDLLTYLSKKSGITMREDGTYLESVDIFQQSKTKIDNLRYFIDYMEAHMVSGHIYIAIEGICVILRIMPQKMEGYELGKSKKVYTKGEMWKMLYKLAGGHPKHREYQIIRLTWN